MIGAAQALCFGQFGRGAFTFTVQGVGGGEPGANERCRWVSTTRLFQPHNSLAGAPLHEIRAPDYLRPKADVGIVRAEPNRPLDERYRLFDRS